MLCLLQWKLLKILILQNINCFDEGGTFSKGNINNGRNVIIFVVHESSLVHANNKTNNICYG